MPRLFNLEVFNQTIDGDGTTPPIYRTGDEHYALLGSADHLLVQLLIDSAETTPATVTVTYELSNGLAEQDWVLDSDFSFSLTAASTAFPYNAYLPLAGTSLSHPAYGRFAVSSDVPGVSARVVVCGRSY